MANDLQFTFKIKIFRQFLDEVVLPTLTDFEHNPTSDRHALICALTMWHLRDWAWAQHKDILKNKLGIKRLNEFDNHLFSTCPVFRVIQNVATGTKHVYCQNPEITDAKLRHRFIQGLLALGTVSHFTVDFNGKTVVFLDALREAAEYWKKFFVSYIDEPVQ